MDEILTLSVCCTFLAVLARATVAQQESVFIALENGLVLHPDSVTSVGNANDVFIDVQCISDEGTLRQWLPFPDTLNLPSPLDPTNTSYNKEDGVLRVFSYFIQEHKSNNGVLNFQCVTDGSTQVIGFNLKSLFFQRDIPSTVASIEDLLSNCTSLLPTLPAFSVTVHSNSSDDGTSYSYCQVDTARGSFRSRGVVVGDINRSRLLFHKAFPPKVVNWETDSGVIRLPCRIMGAGRTLPSIFFLKNGVRIPSASTGGVRIEDVSSNNRRGVLVVEEKRGNEGIYQCVGQAGEDGSTALTTSTYINIQFLDIPTISISSTTTWRPDTKIILGQPDTPSEIVLNCSVEAHPIPTLSWTKRVGDASHEQVVGQQEVTGFRETAFSELHVPVAELKTEVEFRCIATLADHRENASVILAAFSPVVFTKQPDLSDPMTTSANMLTCTASSVPAPDVTWFQIRNGVSVEQTTSHAVILEDELSVTSTLQLAPINDLNVTGYFCRGDNGFFHKNSNIIRTIDSIPMRPSLSVVATTAHSVTIEWTSAPSLIAITQYSTVLYQERDEDLLMVDVRNYRAGTENSTEFEGLRPFSHYSVEVVATNWAGMNASSVQASFRTLEAAPEAPPENILAEAYDTHRIRISWSPPTINLQNGVIHKYLIIFHPVSQPESLNVSDVFNATDVLLYLPLGTGVRYNISVGAVTVDIGPLSEGIVQRTYPMPPAFNSEPPKTIRGFGATENTIPVQLPPVDFSQFSHFWVIVVRLDNSQLSQNTARLFPDNSSFTAYSSDTPVHMPYIVAELSADMYLESRRFFVLGDEDGTRSLNDFPDRYRNGPLMPGSTYTVFVWGFVHSIPPQSSQNESRTKRQEGVRQYSVFSSSESLPATSTLNLVAESGGSSGLNTLTYVAIGVGIPLVLLLCFITTIIVVVQRKMKMIHKNSDDDKLKCEDANASLYPPSSDSTLPRSLTMTGGEVQPEEHIYEDTIYLRACGAYTDTEPTYKVPRPISNRKMAATTGSDDVEYEIPLPRTKQPISDARAKYDTPRQPALEISQSCSNATNGFYEPMECPAAVGRKDDSSFAEIGPPEAYLEPVRISEVPGVLADYVQPTDVSAIRKQPGMKSVGYVNKTALLAASSETAKTAAPASEEYVVMVQQH